MDRIKGILLVTFIMTLINNQLRAENMETGLDKRQQKIATIAANTAIGDLEALKVELAGGLDAGMTVNEIKEILVQMYAYCGFPRSLHGINTFMNVLEERRAQGINDPEGEEGKMVTGSGKYQQGKDTLEELTLRHEAELSGANAFAPAIDVFLKEHLFADIFGRGVLSFQDRELATVSALTGLGGVDPMLQSHLNISLNVGLTAQQLRDAIVVISQFTGQQKAANAGQILDKVILNR